MNQRNWTLILAFLCGSCVTTESQSDEQSEVSIPETKSDSKPETPDGVPASKEQDDMEQETDKLTELTCSRTVNPSSDSNVYATGPLLPNEIIQSLPAKIPAAQSCYEAGFKGDAKIAGVLKMEVSIGAAGKVDSVCFVGDSSLVDLDVWECVKDAVMLWSFPSRKTGGTTATIPLKFRTIQPSKEN